MSTLANETIFETLFEETLEELGISETSPFFADAYNQHKQSQWISFYPTTLNSHH